MKVTQKKSFTVFTDFQQTMNVFPNNQDTPVVSHKAKKKQHVHAQPTQLLVCYLQLPTLKFLSTIAQLSWALPLSYYRAITCLL